MSSQPPPHARYSSPPAFNPATPPPPPPKPPREAPTPSSGPPLPPLPPTRTANQPQPFPHQTPQQPHSQPPDPSEHWLPEVLLNKTTTQLTPLLSSPPLLTSLAHTHPSLHPSPLPPHLASLTALASHVAATHTHLLALRARTQQHLLHLHSLERQWRQKQVEMDKQLEPWSAKVLYQRLVKGEREAEEVSRAMEESWMEGGEGEVGERELGDVVRRWREGRGVVGRRREGRERWDEGRVGGWR